MKNCPCAELKSVISYLHYNYLQEPIELDTQILISQYKINIDREKTRG